MVYCDKECVQFLQIRCFELSLFNVSVSILISIYLITKHLHHFSKPMFQSKIIIILMMAPFYGLTSLCSIQYPKLASYFGLTRDVYLAFLLFTFFYLMFNFMAYDTTDGQMHDDNVYINMMKSQDAIEHLWPFDKCSDKYQLTTYFADINFIILIYSSKAKAKYFTYRCKKFILQYFVIKPTLTFIMLLLQPFIGSERINSILEFLHIFIIISESFSLYYLILFYMALKKPLQPYKPLLKFMIIKITLFFTFWQTIMLSIMRDQILSLFEESIIFDADDIIISIEMLLMSIACIWAFSYKEYTTDTEAIHGQLRDALLDNWNAFQHDLRLIRPKRFGFNKKNVETIDWSQRNFVPDQDFEIELKEFQRLSKAVKITYLY